MYFPWVFWLFIALVLFIVEASTVSLVSIWFAVGALVTAGLSVYVDNFFIQVIVFLVVSALVLYFTRPLLKKYFKIKNTNVNELVGQTCIVLEDIDNIEGIGKVKFKGNVWTAKSKDHSIIKKDELVEINEIIGVSLIVSKKI